MKVILLQDVKNQGKKNDVVEVSDGYALNFLLPKKLAAPATTGVIKEAGEKKAAIILKEQKLKEKALADKEVLSKASVHVKVKCGASGKIFGSVTSKEIAVALNELGYEIDKKDITLKAPIKQVGREFVEVKLYPGVIAKVNVVIEAE